MTEGGDTGLVNMVENLPRSLHSGPQTTRASGRDDNGLLGTEMGSSVLDPYKEDAHPRPGRGARQ
jgi:hypothetical protein